MSHITPPQSTMASTEEVTDTTAVNKSRFRAIPRISFMANELVAIHVGDPATPVHAHKELLCSVSGYFRGAFEGSFREAEEGIISLGDVTERTFKIFLQWAYSQTLANYNKQDIFGPPQVPSSTSGFGGKSFEVPFDTYARSNQVRRTYSLNEQWQNNYNERLLALLHLFIFADKYLVDQLCDDIMTTIIGDCHAWGWWPDPDLTTDIVNTAYDNLPSDSTFTRYLVSSWAYLFAPSKRTASTEQVHRGLHPDFLYDMVIFQTRRLKGEMAQFGEAHADSCCFHEHSIFNHDECRQRLKNNTYIFAALIDACMAEPELGESAPSR